MYSHVTLSPFKVCIISLSINRNTFFTTLFHYQVIEIQSKITILDLLKSRITQRGKTIVLVESMNITKPLT